MSGNAPYPSLFDFYGARHRSICPMVLQTISGRFREDTEPIRKKNNLLSL